jgi:hypothetical protein
MIGPNYWAVGITAKYGYAGSGRYGWSAEVSYLDNGFCSDSTDERRISTEGTLRTRYYIVDGERESGLPVAVDAVKADAERLGITWAPSSAPSVYMAGDGETPDIEYPDNWRDLVNAESARLGWEPAYRVTAPSA